LSKFEGYFHNCLLSSAYSQWAEDLGRSQKEPSDIYFVISDFIAWNSPTSSFISVALSCRTARDTAFNRDAAFLSSSDPLCFYSGREVRGHAHLFKHDADAHVAVELIEITPKFEQS
jgi:hypothetical protein